jgi:hypothetical protein
MWNTVMWTFLACAAFCTVGSLLGCRSVGRMWRIDVIELRQRHCMIKVLEVNTHPLHRDPATDDRNLRCAGTAPSESVH